MPRFKATRPIKYRGVIYAAGEEFDASDNDARAVTRAFGAEPVVAKPRPVRGVATTIAPAPKAKEPELAPEPAEPAEPAPKPAQADTPAPVDDEAKPRPYNNRRLKSKD